MKVLHYIFIAVIGGLLAVIGLQQCSNMSLKKQLAKKDMEYNALNVKWNILISTPPRIITKQKIVEVVHYSPITPTPIPDDTSSTSSQTITSTGDSCKPTRYNETYSIGDTIQVQWAARARGIITQFNILKIKYPTYTTTIERFVPCDPVDTTGILKKYGKVKNQLWLYGRPQMIIVPFKIMDVSLGIQWQVKRKWGLGIGGGYNWIINSPTADLIILFNLL